MLKKISQIGDVECRIGFQQPRYFKISMFLAGILPKKLAEKPRRQYTGQNTFKSPGCFLFIHRQIDKKSKYLKKFEIWWISEFRIRRFPSWVDLVLFSSFLRLIAAFDCGMTVPWFFQSIVVMVKWFKFPLQHDLIVNQFSHQV